MAQMAEEEAWALEDEISRNPPDVAGKQGGFFTDRRDRMVILDTFSAGYIKSVAEVAHKTPAQIIGEMVRERITLSAQA
jgi:hypothetical protein